MKLPWIGGVALIALLVIGTLFLRNTSQETRISEGLSTSGEKPTPPLSANPSEPLPEKPPRSSPNSNSTPAQPGKQNSGNMKSIEGCWNWLNNALLTARGNGMVATGPFTGRWQLVDSGRRIYTLTWPKAVDNVELSADGNSMKGGNQYGFSMSAAREGGGGAPGNLVGAWRWFNGVTIFINANGTLQAGPLVAQWQPTDARGRTFAITWPEPVDTLTLSPDGTSLSGGNQFGVAVAGKRTTCPGEN